MNLAIKNGGNDMSLEPGSMYEYSFTPKELIYQLFKRKRCPICGEKLYNSNKQDFTGVKSVNKAKFQRMPSSAPHYSVSIEYYCKNCDISFPISELADSK